MPPPPPPTTLQYSRVNLSDLKSQIAHRVGPDRARSYFAHFSRFLSLKLTKSEFDKRCLSTLGRENVHLHNQLIRAVFRNAHHARTPPTLPQPHGTSSFKHVGMAEPKLAPTENAGLHPLPCGSPTSPVWSNGDLLSPPSPRKIRTGVRDRRAKDSSSRPSPLGPNGKIETGPMLPVKRVAPTADHVTIRENGSLSSCDLRRPVQQHNQASLAADQPTVRQWTQKQFQTNQVPLHSKEAMTAQREDEERKQQMEASTCRGPLKAPIGIPFCSASAGASRRPQPLATSSNCSGLMTNSYIGELCNTEVLKERMEHIASAQGLGGVTLDCANVVNNGLDAYLKRLIESCMKLVGDRRVSEPIRQQFTKQQPQEKTINGLWPANHIQLPSSSGSDGLSYHRRHCSISLLDFRLAMELNPQLLGEDWPLQLERILHHSFED